jgi:predicted DsbA family dithiol-disulfide isomerase
MAKPSPVRVPVFYDFSSTICYFTHRVLGRLRPELDALGIELDWSPIDLVRITAWRRGEPFGTERTRNLERLSRELGVPVAMPTHWMDSRAAMTVAAGLTGARDGDQARWRDAVWTWVYHDARSLDEPGALHAIASRAAVDVGAAGAPGAPAFEEIERRTAIAHAAGVRGVPTFLLDAWPVGIGIQEPETMLDFLRRFAAKKPATTGQLSYLREGGGSKLLPRPSPSPPGRGAKIGRRGVR